MCLSLPSRLEQLFPNKDTHASHAYIPRGPIVKDLSDVHPGGCSLIPYFVRVLSDTYRGSVYGHYLKLCEGRH